MVKNTECCGCSACYNACPKQCISMVADSLGFLFPHIDETKCIKCNICEKVCPVLSKGRIEDAPSKTWGGHARDEVLRLASSSGGLFSLFATTVINDGGVVYGAALENGCKTVKHIRVERVEDLAVLRGSKYVQSDIGNTYTQAKNDLQEGRMVLFSGTPCQIDGLKLFLREEYKHLLTVEIICHGTPSPRIYADYIKHMQKKLGGVIKRVSFRDEIRGGILIMKIETETGTVYKEDKFTDPFFKMFLSDTCLRESCYQCPSRGLHFRADITLSDFWGVEDIAPDLIDGGGISLVIIHTEKGMVAFDRIEKQCIGHEVDFSVAIKGNNAFFNSYARPKLRDRIDKDINVMEFEEIVRKYTVTKKEYIKKVLDKFYLVGIVKRILGRIKYL